MTRHPSGRPALRYFLFGAALALTVSACGPTIDSRGNLAEATDIRRINVGVTTKPEVARLLGSPSVISSFDKNTWYYISRREERLAFFKPEVKHQLVVEVRFSGEGVVQRIRRYTLSDARSVSTVSRKTPVRAGEPGMIRSMWESMIRGPRKGSSGGPKKFGL